MLGSDSHLRLVRAPDTDEAYPLDNTPPPHSGIVDITDKSSLDHQPENRESYVLLDLVLAKTQQRVNELFDLAAEETNLFIRNIRREMALLADAILMYEKFNHPPTLSRAT